MIAAPLATHRPRVSLVVPVRDEEASIGALIDSILHQTRAPDEVIFVDGGSKDRTVERIGELTMGDKRFRIIRAGDATPGRGRNIGIAAAENAWVALTDAGITLEPTWLERLVAVTEREPSLAVVFGNFEPVTRTHFERWAALAYPPPKRLRPGGRMRGPSVASMLLRRDIHEAVGGFPDLRACEDLMFLERMEKQAIPTGWAPTATVWWQLQPNFARTYRKFLLYSKHNVRAGRQRDWHYGVARQYLVGLVFGVIAVAVHPAWIAIPVLGALARVAKSIMLRREGRGVLWLLNPIQFVGVGLVLATIDAAMFIGWAQVLLAREKSAVESQRGPGSRRDAEAVTDGKTAESQNLPATAEVR